MHSTVSVVALIGVLGMASQWIAWRLQLPAIVLMSIAGLIAGPGLGVLAPSKDFGEFLQPMISLAVAVILFEGGLSLHFRELGSSAKKIWRLVIPGAPLAWALGAIAAHYAAGLSWPVAILFAGILVVTGPTVIVPLLRQAKLSHGPRTLLKWEGIINDPLGALIAVLVFEFLVATGGGQSVFEAAAWVGLASAVALAIGCGLGWFIAYVFPRGWVPEFLKVPVLLATVIAGFAAANAIEHETGLVAVTAMGIFLGNSRVASLVELRRFKEHMTVILVSGIFVLLTATLKPSDLTGLGFPALLFLLAILFVVRPLSIWISLVGTGTPWREKLLVGWIAPRGIVAVAVTGVFGPKLMELGYADARQLVPLSFAVVFATILAHGFSIEKLARRLDLVSTRKPGVLIVGASAWATQLALKLKELEIPVTIADTSWYRLKEARLKDIPTYYGEVLSEVAEHRLEAQQFGALLALSGNEAYNALVCKEFAPEIGRDRVFELGQHAKDDPHGLSFTVRGRTLLPSGIGLDELLKRSYTGWTFQKTKLTEKYVWDQYLSERHADADTVFALKKTGALQFASRDGKNGLEPGDIVVAFSPKREKMAPEAPPKPNQKPDLPDDIAPGEGSAGATDKKEPV
ncbi:MAG: sodium:proton antiporter [Pseudomonadota bacterium]